MMKTLLIPALLLFAATTAQAAPIRLADGEYSCSLGSMILGKIWIKGGTYVGPSHEQKGPSHKFAVTEKGTINWGAKLGGMDSGGNKVVGTVIRDAGKGRYGFDIQMQTDRGTFLTSSCAPNW